MPLLGGRHLAYVISFNPHNKQIGPISLIIIIIMKKMILRVNDVASDTYLENGEIKIQI